jgi:aminopeptidase N
MVRRPHLSLLVRVLAALVTAVAACSPSAQTLPRPLPPPAELATVLPPPRDDGHLPPLATPLRYALSFEIDPRKATFAGSVRIEVDVPATTSYVVLNGHGQTISDARALVAPREGSPDGPREVDRQARVTSRAAHGATPGSPEELVLAFDPPIPPGRATLAITYSAPFDQELSGLYRVADGGAWYAFTQFEATDARRAFPCFDEPGYKVPFALTVTVPKGMLAFGNSPETERQEDGTKTTFRFAETPPLPTYLVALAVGDLEVKELARTTTPPIRLITTKG